jgi:uncharacterized protein with HEPN domain
MRHFARKAIGVFNTASADALENDTTAHFAIRYLVMTVGEAANRVSPEFRAAHPEIPWVDVIGMRNRLAHGYDQVSREILHDTVALYLPKLVGQLDAILADESRG